MNEKSFLVVLDIFEFFDGGFYMINRFIKNDSFIISIPNYDNLSSKDRAETFQEKLIEQKEIYDNNLQELIEKEGSNYTDYTDLYSTIKNITPF